MKITTLAVSALLLVACDSASMALVAHSADVKGCKPLGEVVGSDAPMPPDERLVTLRTEAARQGATHLVSEGADKGLMYECASDSRTETRSDRRVGF